MSERLIQQLDDDGVLLIQFNRPKRKNAFDDEQWNLFRDALLAAQDNPAVACVLLYGGDDFSAGADLSSFGNSEGSADPFETAARALIDFNKPIVAAVNGVSVGGGATLLLYCDVVYVSETLRMRFPFAQLGVVPEWGSSYTLESVVGARTAAELMLTAEWIDADRAVDTGIATAQIPFAEIFDVARAKAGQIARWPISSLVEIKRLLRDGRRDRVHRAMDAEQEAMMRVAGSPENIEAVVAFMEKREPDFKQFRK